MVEPSGIKYVGSRFLSVSLGEGETLKIGDEEIYMYRSKLEKWVDGRGLLRHSNGPSAVRDKRGALDALLENQRFSQ